MSEDKCKNKTCAMHNGELMNCCDLNTGEDFERCRGRKEYNLTLVALRLVHTHIGLWTPQGKENPELLKLIEGQIKKGES